jgi:hypothetical protein
VFFIRRESVRKHTLDFLNENLPLVLCIIGGAIVTIPLLGYGPLIAMMLGLAVGTIALDRLADSAT